MKLFKSVLSGIPVLALCTLMLLSACGDGSKAGDKDKNAVKKDTTPEIVYNRYWNDLARYLGGKAPMAGSTLDSIEYRPEAEEYRKWFDSEWDNKNNSTPTSLTRLEKWASVELKDARATNRTVFYPFSGPDFATVHTLFPNAQRYVLFGLEPEGVIPDIKQINKKSLPVHLNRMKKAMRELIGRSYFITSYMGGDLAGQDFNGTLAVLLAFMGRQNCEVLDVQRIKVKKDGQFAPVAETEKIALQARDSLVTGMFIKFRQKKGAPIQTLEYYSLDISDPYFNDKKNTEFAQLLKGMGATTTYIKSASYLLHWNEFSNIRKLLLDVTQQLIQDDTGVAYRYIDQEVWDIRLYGRYTQPIKNFPGQFQRDLDKAFNDAKPQPLDFYLGYNALQKAANILVATKKPKTADKPAPKPATKAKS